MNKDMYVWMCIYMIYIDRCIYIYIYMTSILEEVTMLDLVFRRWQKWHYVVEAKTQKTKKKTKQFSEEYVELPDGESRLLPCALKDQFNETNKGDVRKAWLWLTWGHLYCDKQNKIQKNKQGGGDISAAAIWIEAFRRKGKTDSTKNRPILYFLTTFKAPFLCNKAERLSWTSVWTLCRKDVRVCVCVCVEAHFMHD